MRCSLYPRRLGPIMRWRPCLSAALLLAFVVVSLLSGCGAPVSQGKSEPEWLRPCPKPEIDTSSWVVIDRGKFSFLVPPEFSEVKVQGIDSWVGEFLAADSSAKLTFDWGWYSDPLTRPELVSQSHFESCKEIIGERRARLITLQFGGAGPYGSSVDMRYCAGAAWRDITPGVHLTLVGVARDQRRQEECLAVLRTVRFGNLR